MQISSEGSFLGDSKVLELSNIHFSWPSGKQALNNCSFYIPGPGLWMLVGSNGSGKSTLLKVINGMLKASRGIIFCPTKPFLVFQNPDHQLLLPTCGSDLMLSLSQKNPSVDRKDRIEEVLDQVGLNDMSSRPIHTLSGGQKQRLALASALISGANFLLLDEPTALLDPESQEFVLKIVHSLCTQPDNPITALWITHRLEELEFANGAARMERGRVGAWKPGSTLAKQLRPLAGKRG